jgi:hypothetical protein
MQQLADLRDKGCPRCTSPFIVSGKPFSQIPFGEKLTFIFPHYRSYPRFPQKNFPFKKILFQEIYFTAVFEMIISNK